MGIQRGGRLTSGENLSLSEFDDFFEIFFYIEVTFLLDSPILHSAVAVGMETIITLGT